MENTGYTTLTRQTGLLREMTLIANNIANASTTGFRQEGMIFSEYIASPDDAPSISMANGNVRNTSYAQGTLSQTGGTFDFAIEGDAFFLVETANGERLTRAGSFLPNEAGELVTADGNRVLDAGGAPVFIPPNTAISVASDGTLSADGRPLAQIGLVKPSGESGALLRETGVLFEAEEGFEEAEDATMVQGFLESSNVNTVLQLTRMIEVQRAYEMGQKFLEREDERVRSAVKSMIR
ncbi:flagellar hook-basal body complex protein [Poseidonocella sedimentorum]|uniref:Flagellar basal-body rod protein FlgF n=1 Tax=Poseidonocella sedimentorum TaxID=871652 RepID=A0A1I6D5N2_9RHOB|nr:flagellar hook-basal body complex protein [Poseidonocella sedimentorum]SFR00671.1 flagellar basal-body rod protein FlgF [Poseidonocella sedimentorum]